MVHAKVDPITGGKREDVFMAQEDATKLNLQDGDAILVKNELGEFNGKVKIAPMRPRNLQMHWPEANVLLQADIIDVQAGVPDYNALVEIIPVRENT